MITGWWEAWKLRSREEAVRDILGDDVPDHQVRRIVARSQHPHLRVGKGRLYAARRDGRWWWEVVSPHAVRLDAGTAPSHAEAVAVGLAALEAASVERISP